MTMDIDADRTFMRWVYCCIRTERTKRPAPADAGRKFIVILEPVIKHIHPRVRVGLQNEPLGG